MLLPAPTSRLATFPKQSKASPLSSPTNIARRLPRTRSRTRMTARASLESIVEESLSDGLDAHPTRAMIQDATGSTRDSGDTRVSRPLSWNGKDGIIAGRGMRDVCGICFESAVKPNKSRCCGQLFCYQHLSDWLSAAGSDGRCPTCRVPLSLETDTIFLHPPAKKLPAVRFLPAQPPSHKRSPTSSWPRRFALVPRRTSSSSGLSSGSSSSQEYDSDVGSSSTSESEGDNVLKHSRVLSIPSRYESVAHLMSDLVPLREFGSLLSLLGCALVIGTLLS